MRARECEQKLWVGQGRRADARDVLAAIYDWFTSDSAPR
jgi:hypothetical protein